MEKDKALEIISLVKSRRSLEWEEEMLNIVESHILAQEPFSYQDTMTFIQSKMSSKLGGKYIYTNRVLEFLKNELKKENKKK